MNCWDEALRMMATPSQENLVLRNCLMMAARLQGKSGLTCLETRTGTTNKNIVVYLCGASGVRKLICLLKDQKGEQQTKMSLCTSVALRALES